MTTKNRMNRRTITGVIPAGTLVIGVGLEGVINGGNRVGMTFDLSQVIAGLTFTSTYEIRKTQDGAWGLAGSDSFGDNAIRTADLTGVVGYELRVTLSHDGVLAYNVPVECVIQ